MVDLSTLSRSNHLLNSNNRSIDLFSKAFCIYLLSLPLGALSLPGGFGSVLKIVALLPLVAWIFCPKCKSLKKENCFHLLWILLIGTSFAWSISPSNTLDRFITNFLFLLLIIPLSSLKFENKHIKMMKRALVLSSRITLILALLFASFDYGRLHFSGILSEDPNYLCCYFSFGVVNIFLSFFSGKNKKYWFLYIFELIAYFYVILFTGSRGGALAILSAIIVSLFVGSRKNLAFSIFYVIIAFTIGFSLFFLASKLVPSSVIERFSLQSIIDSDGTGRYEIWEAGISIFKNSSFSRKLLGYGSGTVREMFLAYGYRGRVMHNIFLETLCENGLLGLVVYTIMLVQYLIICFKRKDAFSLCVLVSMIVLSLSTSLYAFKPYWNVMLLIIAVSNIKKPISFNANYEK